MVEYPEWYDGKNVNDVKFCEELLKIHPMKSVNGTFFTVEGRVTDEDALRCRSPGSSFSASCSTSRTFRPCRS